MPACFRIWLWGDAHVGTDLHHGRESLAEALRQSAGGDPNSPSFDWDVALNIGDLSGSQAAPTDEEGREVVRQYRALATHPRESVYDIAGNHDRSHPREPAGWWFRRWVDPLGEHPEYSGVHRDRRPYPIEGTWERYMFTVGNLLFLMMSDINEPTQQRGRGDLGGNPGGVVSGETFEWWKQQVLGHPEHLIVSVHHYMLKNTTVASGPWEGMQKRPDGLWESGYHGYKPEGTPQGASYLYWVGSVPDAEAFERFLAAHPGRVALWIGGHTHPLNPDDRAGGKPITATRWGTHFINAAGLTRYHSHHAFRPSPMSRLLTLREGETKIHVQLYLHTDDYSRRGWYAPAERWLTLPRPFRLADPAKVFRTKRRQTGPQVGSPPPVPPPSASTV